MQVSHSKAAFQAQLPELARALFSTQLERLDARPAHIPYGIMGRIDNPDSQGWCWACSPYPDVLPSCLRMTALRPFALREDPQVGYTVVSLLSSSDARLMNERWRAGRGLDGDLSPRLLRGGCRLSLYINHSLQRAGEIRNRRLLSWCTSEPKSA